MKSTSTRMQHLSPHFFAGWVARIQGLQRAGEDVIRLDVGSPDLPPPPEVIDVLAHTAAAGNTHGYQPHNGPDSLRLAWAEMYERQYGVQIDPNREVVPLLGSKEGIFNLVMACIDRDDVVLVPDPGYITYTRATQFAGGEPYYLPLEEQNGFLPDFDSLPAAVLRRTKMLWLNYPNNPTAATASEEFFARTIAFAREKDLLVCHDAAYSQVVFDGYQAPSILQTPGAKECAVEFNTLSKSHNMAGWRVGAALGNRTALQALYALKTNLDSGHFLPIMEAATTALGVPQRWILERNRAYQQRRDIVVQALRAMGLAAQIPRASLYVWSPVPEGWTSLDFASTLLERARISITPGTVFGKYGEGFVRIALTAPAERMQEAMRRMKKVVGQEKEVRP
jgi:LL-diaminopimelate aminotransferase